MNNIEWKMYDPGNKRLVCIGSKIDAVHFAALSMPNRDINFAAKEINAMNHEAPMIFYIDADNPITNGKERVRLEILSLHPDPEKANKFTLPRKYNYGGSLSGKYWFSLSCDNIETFDLHERWNWFITQIDMF